MRKFLLLILICSIDANAGLHGFTVHSRANCANNESIAWWFNHNLYLNTTSQHFYDGYFMHKVMTGWEYTWRSAAVHWNEAYPGNKWSVAGVYYIADDRGNQHYLGKNYVTDCSIYDGWWG